MSDIVIVAMVAGASSITVAIITVIVKDFLDNKKRAHIKIKEEAITHDDMYSMVLIQEWLEGFREKYHFDRTAIYQFHNGGKFFQGKSMKKFSMTYESAAPGYAKVKSYHQNILASDRPRWITKMLKDDCFLTSVDDMNSIDRIELDTMGIQEFSTTVIHSLQGNLIGFLVGYNVGKSSKEIVNNFDDMVEDAKFVSGYL